MKGRKNMIKLYGIPVSNNVNKVRYCLNYLGLEYQLEPTNPMKGENKTPEYLAISPSGKIPAIDVDGFTLFESSAINRYLAATHNSSLYPQDEKTRAVIDSWTDFASIHVQNGMGRVLFNRVMAPMIGAEKDENSEKAGIEFLERFLPVCDQQLGKNAYLAGENITLADFALLAVLDPHELIQFSLEPYENVVKWRTGLLSQDFYKKCYGSYTEFVQSMMAPQI